MATVIERYEFEFSAVEVKEEIEDESILKNRTTFKAHCGYCKVSTKPHWRQARERKSRS